MTAKRRIASWESAAAERDAALARLAAAEFYAAVLMGERDASVARLAAAETALARAAYVAEHLHGMIPREVWRDHGGDDGQGHYEGDYHAEQIADEIKGFAAVLVPDPAAASAPIYCSAERFIDSRLRRCDRAPDHKGNHRSGVRSWWSLSEPAAEETT